LTLPTCHFKYAAHVSHTSFKTLTHLSAPPLLSLKLYVDFETLSVISNPFVEVYIVMGSRWVGGYGLNRN